MKVVLIDSKGDFEIENKGLGIQTYIYELANRLKTPNVDLHLLKQVNYLLLETVYHIL